MYSYIYIHMCVYANFFIHIYMYIYTQPYSFQASELVWKQEQILLGAKLKVQKTGRSWEMMTLQYLAQVLRMRPDMTLNRDKRFSCLKGFVLEYQCYRCCFMSILNVNTIFLWIRFLPNKDNPLFDVTALLILLHFPLSQFSTVFTAGLVIFFY